MCPIKLIGVSGYGAGYREGSRVVPIPNRNYRAAERPRKQWAIAINWGAHLLPAYRRLPGFSAIATSLSFRECSSYQTPTKIRAACAIAPPTAPRGAAAAPLTASGNRCAHNWLPGSLPRQRFVAGIAANWFQNKILVNKINLTPDTDGLIVPGFITISTDPR